MAHHPAPPQPDSPDLLRELAQRLLTQPQPDAPAPGPPRLLPGQLPAGPDPLPLPDPHRVLGSLVRGSQTTLVFDSPLAPEHVRAFYDTHLPALGWTHPAHPLHRHGGFVPTGFEEFAGTVFCRGPRGPALRLQTFALAQGGTDVRLTLDQDARHAPCAPPRLGSGLPDPWAVLPPLTAPPGGRQFPEGGGGSPDRINSATRLNTDQDLPAVTAHYEAQLAGAGWVRQAGAQQDLVAWSTWNFQDAQGEPWRALFFLLRRPDQPGEYLLWLRAEWTQAGARNSGDTGWSFMIPH
jgi:hypothetical protein